MKKQIELHTQNIEYTLRVSTRIRRMRFAFYVDGTLVVTIPTTMPESLIEPFIASKSHWILNTLSRFNNITSKMTACEPAEAVLVFVRSRLHVLNEHYHFVYQKVAIRNQKTRWGSCSKKGNLNFNVRIASLPIHLADYIIVHELCHLGEFNHSQKFWSLVARAIPDHRERRKELRGILIDGFLQRSL